MRRLAEHDLATDVPCVGRGDEIGAMAGAVRVFKDNMITGDRMAVEQLAEQKAQQQRSSRIEGLVSDFERQISGTVTILASAATEMEATARSMTGSAAQTDQQAAAVARAAEDSGIGVQDGGVRLRAARLVHHRDQPPGVGVGDPDRQGGRQRPAHRRYRSGAGRERRPDRPRGGADQQHRQPDQPAGAERHHRGRPRRRRRQGLRRGRVRGEEPGAADGEGDRRDRRPDRAACSRRPTAPSRRSGRSRG